MSPGLWLNTLGTAVPRGVTRLRRNPPPQPYALLVLVFAAAGLLLCAHLFGSELFPPGLQAVPLLFGGLLLGRRAFLQLCAAVAVAVLAQFTLESTVGAPPGSIAVVTITGLVAHEFVRSGEETGLGGLRGDSVLVELGRRLNLQGALPPLPASWGAEAVVRPAGGGPFAGDFVVSALTGEGRRLEVALVDVSGKGAEAGTRALLLSGALGGLLGSRGPEEFLPAGNDYLCRQEWDEGFATAVHVVVDLDDGAYRIESAGHPPVARLDAGTGRWELDPAEGLALGLLPGARYVASTGFLRPGDALILYTDGLVEIPGRDLSVGIDKLLGEAERLVTSRFEGGADLLVTRVAEGSNDDRGLVLLWRRR